MPTRPFRLLQAGSVIGENRGLWKKQVVKEEKNAYIYFIRTVGLSKRDRWGHKRENPLIYKEILQYWPKSPFVHKPQRDTITFGKAHKV